MERTTALSTAGAFTLTAAAAVSALFLTLDRGAQAATATDPAVMEPEVVTEYEVVQLQPEAPAVEGIDEPSADDVGEIIYEVEYVNADGSAAAYEGGAEYEDEHPEDESEEDEYPEDEPDEDHEDA